MHLPRPCSFHRRAFIDRHRYLIQSHEAGRHRIKKSRTSILFAFHALFSFLESINRSIRDLIQENQSDKPEIRTSNPTWIKIKTKGRRRKALKASTPRNLSRRRRKLAELPHPGVRTKTCSKRTEKKNTKPDRRWLWKPTPPAGEHYLRWW